MLAYVSTAGDQNHAGRSQKLRARAGVQKIGPQRMDAALDRCMDACSARAGMGGAHRAVDGNLQVLHVG